VVIETFAEKEFDYIVPEHLAGQISEGTRVSIPFGKRHAVGYVVELKDRSAVKGLKEIAGLVDPEPILDAVLFKLVKWIADYYCSTVGAVIKAALPASARDMKKRKTGEEYIQIEKHPPAEALAQLRKRAPKQHALLAMLIKEGVPLRLCEVRKSFQVTSAVITSLADKGYIRLSLVEEKPFLIGTPGPAQTRRIEPTGEQTVALQKIIHAVDGRLFQTFLLFGVTGSGKTEIYLRAIEHSLAKGKGAIVLVPEISLTPQTVERFNSRFGGEVAVLHSGMTQKERFGEWKRIKAGAARIVVGARSCIFAPVKDLGLIVVDEEHDKSFKQDNNPRYNARDVAVVRAKLLGAVVILGSATPSLESFHNVTRGKYELLELTKRVDNKKMPRVGIVDMKLESDRAKKGVIFSHRLLRGIEERLKKKEQVILFLNRRGHSSVVICDSCGYVVKCDHCSVSMTYHDYGKRLLCHLCGHQKEMTDVCASCGAKIRYGGCGTQKVQELIAKFFPQARVARMDADSTAFRGAHADILGKFRDGHYDILVGTQMIAKGLDFPNVTLVGVINADIALNFPDFRCGEFTFQLLTQVAGRSGRGDVEGEVIVQTFLPNHYAIQAARLHDFRTFYEKEFQFRQELGYPPVIHFVTVMTAGRNETRVMETASALEEKLRKAGGDLKLLSAAPAPIVRAKRDFRWQIVLKGRSILRINEALKKAAASLKVPRGVKFFIDVDPQIMM
jgi:primosomal protein N' (replication factor Y)